MPFFQILITVLRERWGENVARLFERVWYNEAPADEVEVRASMEVARRLEEQGKLVGALESCQAQALAPAGSRLAEELQLIMESPRTRFALAEAVAADAKHHAEELRLIAEGLKTEGTPTEARAKAEAVAADLKRRAEEPRIQSRVVLEEVQKDLSLAAQELKAQQQRMEAAKLVQLFEEGMIGHEREERTKAKERLTETVRQQPDYERTGQKASDLLAEAERRLAPPRREGMPRWISVLSRLAALAFIVVGAVAGGCTPSPEATPTVIATVAPSPTPTDIPTIAPSPTLMPTRTPPPTRTPTQTPHPTPTTTRVPTTIPKLKFPEQGQTYQSPITFQWEGRLGPGQTYLVRAWHPESGFSLQSPPLYTASWTVDLPGEKFGEWRWNVSVLTGSSMIVASAEGMFWFNPFPGGGDEPYSGGILVPPMLTGKRPTPAANLSARLFSAVVTVALLIILVMGRWRVVVGRVHILIQSLHTVCACLLHRSCSPEFVQQQVAHVRASRRQLKTL